MTKNKRSDTIIEKKLGIPPDYQYQALRSANFLQSNWHANKFYVIGKILELTKAREVLDLGTGSGNFELIYANKLTRIVGIDYNDQALDFLHQRLRSLKIYNVQLILKDLQELEQINNIGKFDLILLIDVIEHLNLRNAKILVSHLASFLKPGGHVCIITPNYKSPWILIEKLMDKFTYFPKFEGEQHLAKFHQRNLKHIMEANRYSTTLTSTFNLLSFLFPTRLLARWICKFELELQIPFGNLLLGVFKKQV